MVILKYPGFNLMISYHNDLSILTLNSILVGLGIITIILSLVYYRGATKEDKDISTTDKGHSSICE